MYWIDTHAHISLFNDDELMALFERGKSRDLQFWMMAGYDAKDWQRQELLVNKYPQKLSSCFGLHPWRVVEMSDQDIADDMSLLKTYLLNSKALGETGIDKFKTQDPAKIKKQEEIFYQHMELNTSLNLPLVLHVVRAENEALRVLSDYSYTGVVHGFSASYETAKRYVALGYKIGVGRGVFLKGYRNLKETVEKLSMDDLLVESDTDPNADKTVGDSVDVFFKVVEAIATLKKMSQEDVLRQNFLNAKKVFNL